MLGSPEVGVYITVEGNHVMQSAFTFRGQQTQQMNCGSDQEQQSFTSFSFCLAVLKEKSHPLLSEGPKVIMWYVSDVCIIYYGCLWKPHLI